MRSLVVSLPSQGLLGYPADFEIREWSVNEIRSFFTSKRQLAKMLDFVRGCILSPSGPEFKFQKIALSDVSVLVIEVRKLSIDNHYEYKTPCRVCRTAIPMAVDLDDLVAIPIRKDTVPTFNITLPDTGKVLTMRHLLVEDQMDIEKQNTLRKQKLGLDYDDGFVYSRAKQICEINNERVSVPQAEGLVQKLSAHDMAAFEQGLADASFGYDLRTSYECPHCGDVKEVTISLAEEFLFRAPKRNYSAEGNESASQSD